MTLRWLLLGCVVAGSVGCNKGSDWMPLQQGRQWTYLCRVGMSSQTVVLKASRQIPIGASSGWELTSSRGILRVGWAGPKLLMTHSGSSRFQPPLPILNMEAEPVTWRGWVESLGRRYPAKATITSSPQKLTLNGRTRKTTKAVVDLKIDDRKVELATWFEPGIGIVQQEQREQGRLKLSLQWLASR